MKDNELEYIIKVLKIANLLKIENVIFEPNIVRGMDNNQSIVLFQDQNVPSFEFGSIGINRIDLFLSRINLLQGTKFNVEYVTTGEDTSIGYSQYDPKIHNFQPMWVRSLTLSSPKTSIDYRATNPTIIKVPKKRADINKFSCSMSQEIVDVIQKGKSAMKTDLVTFKGTPKQLIIHITDINNDTLKFNSGKQIKLTNDTEIASLEFNYGYSIDTILQLFKNNPTDEFFITAKGFLCYNFNNIDIYIAPKTNT